MRKLFVLLSPALFLLILGCGQPTAEMADVPEVPADNLATLPDPALNTLTDAETADGWLLLFDGRSLASWHPYGKTDQPTPGAAWKVNSEEGFFYLDNSTKVDGRITGGGDIITDDSYESYELSLEWRIDSCGNSGIIYNVLETPEYDYPWLTGPEMQILDNDCHPDAKYPDHRAGDLYDLVAVREQTVRPAGEWNEIRLVNRAGNIEHWQNGVNVVSYDMNQPAWKTMVAESKFKDMPDFGTSKTGRISLQDHGDRVSFRNVKIRKL